MADTLRSALATASGTALQEMLVQRYIATCRDLVEHLPDVVVRRALEQNTGLESLAVGIGAHAVAIAADRAHARAARLLPVHGAHAALLAQSGGAVTAVAAGALLGNVSRQAVEKRRLRGTLLAVTVGGEYRYPVFQFDDLAVLTGLPAVLQAFTIQSPWAQLAGLLSPHDCLDGRSVVTALRDGDTDG